LSTFANSDQTGYEPISDENKRFIVGAEILLVEDNRAHRTVATILLEDLGCQITIARNGEEAIEKAKTHPFDLILMDCEMPEMDGFEASIILGKMKKHGEIRDVPIIALTAHTMLGDREQCLKAGMNDYLVKPLEKSELHDLLIQWLPPKRQRVITNI